MTPRMQTPHWSIPPVAIWWGVLTLAALVVMLAACGRGPTSPPVTLVVRGPCYATKTFTFTTDDGQILNDRVRAHWPVCPSDSALASGGWTREP